MFLMKVDRIGLDASLAGLEVQKVKRKKMPSDHGTSDNRKENMADFSYNGITVNLKQEETWTIAWALLRDACDEHALNTHYSIHGVETWKSNEKHKVALARQFFRAIGREEIVDSRLNEVEVLLRKKCEERKDSK